MKSARPSNKVESSAPGEDASIISQARFKGTDNPRHLRALSAMLHRPLARENLDSVAGCSNGPQLVADLRDLGPEVPCDRVPFTDRDGKLCRPGVYWLTEPDRSRVNRWLAQRPHGGAAA